MTAGSGQAQTASLVQYASDSESDSESPSAPPPKAAPATGSSIMPRSIKPVKRSAPAEASVSSGPSSSLLAQHLPAPVAKKIKLDSDPFGLGNGSQKSSVSTKISPTTNISKFDSRPAQSSSSSTSSTSRIAQTESAISVSNPTAQVTVESEADEIPFGWAQDPDGTLYPVTPQAHQQYAEWQAAQAAAQKAEAKASADPAAGKEDMPSYSAAQLAESGRKPNASSSALDARYAAAAAEVAGESADGAPAAKTRGTNSRARYKGQLSALLAIAKEREEELQDKHAQGKDRQRDARLRYGF